MNLILKTLLLFPFLVFSQLNDETMAFIEGGSYVPLYRNDENNTKETVGDFYMDKSAVTNSAFSLFLEQFPQWKKENIKSVFAESNYLSHWENEFEADAPVTNVSWFVAKKYCESQQKRLPTLAEWEYVALADQNQKDARSEPSHNQYILDWYESPKARSPKKVKSTFKNKWNVFDIHGLIWEWTYDFNSVLISGESRKDVKTDRNLFCGSGSVDANDLMNYAAFIRYAFRGSIKANYCIQNLGFRCVKDLK